MTHFRLSSGLTACRVCLTLEQPRRVEKTSCLGRTVSLFSVSVNKRRKQSALPPRAETLGLSGRCCVSTGRSTNSTRPAAPVPGDDRLHRPAQYPAGRYSAIGLRDPCGRFSFNNRGRMARTGAMIVAGCSSKARSEEDQLRATGAGGRGTGGGDGEGAQIDRRVGRDRFQSPAERSECQTSPIRQAESVAGGPSIAASTLSSNYSVGTFSATHVSQDLVAQAVDRCQRPAEQRARCRRPMRRGALQPAKTCRASASMPTAGLYLHRITSGRGCPDCVPLTDQRGPILPGLLGHPDPPTSRQRHLFFLPDTIVYRSGGGAHPCDRGITPSWPDVRRHAGTARRRQSLLQPEGPPPSPPSPPAGPAPRPFRVRAPAPIHPFASLSGKNML